MTTEVLEHETEDAAPAPAASEFSRLLGANLRAMRKARGLSLVKASALFPGRMRPQTLRSWEMGIREMPIERLAQLAAFYGVPAAQLIP